MENRKPQQKSSNKTLKTKAKKSKTNCHNKATNKHTIINNHHHHYHGNQCHPQHQHSANANQSPRNINQFQQQYVVDPSALSSQHYSQVKQAHHNRFQQQYGNPMNPSALSFESFMHAHSYGMNDNSPQQDQDMTTNQNMPELESELESKQQPEPCKQNIFNLLFRGPGKKEKFVAWINAQPPKYITQYLAAEDSRNMTRVARAYNNDPDEDDDDDDVVMASSLELLLLGDVWMAALQEVKLNSKLGYVQMRTDLASLGVCRANIDSICDAVKDKLSVPLGPVTGVWNPPWLKPIFKKFDF